MRVGTVVLASVLGAAQWLCAVPSNDLFSAAVLLSGEDISLVANNGGAGKEAGEPDHANEPGAASVWWKWKAPDHGETEIVTDGSDFQTLLAVYTGSSVTGLSEIISNDDHADKWESRVRFAAESNVTYHLVVDGKASSISTGEVHLALTFDAGMILSPDHDLFTNATVVSGMFFSVSSSNVNALREPGEPLHAHPRAGGNASVWWKWTAEGSGRVLLNTRESSIDTLLGVYQGESLMALSEIASSDDILLGEIFTSEVAFSVEKDETFMIAVDGYDGEMGDLMLNMEWLTLPYEIESRHGEPMPGVGTYTNDWGAVVTNGCTPFERYDTTQYVCTGWALSGGTDTNGVSVGSETNMVMVLTNNSMLSWLWLTNYWLNAETDGWGWVIPSNGWRHAGSNVVITAVPDPHYHFTSWSGPGTNWITTGDIHSATVTVSMTSPVQLRAGFAMSFATNGVPHWWLAEHGFSSPFDSAALSDSDGDGLMAWEEFYADTIPTNSASVLKFISIESLDDGVRILWQGGQSAQQLLESCDTAGLGQWSTIFTNDPPTATETNFIHTLQKGTFGFYRLRVPGP